MNRIIRIGKERQITALAVVILVLVSISYGYRCGFQKVCGVAAVDQLVRHEHTLTTSNGTKLTIEVADTQESRELGLSGRAEIASGKGMLFVFDHPGKYGFWMKDMKFSIDMVWINQDGVVVHVERNASPSSYFDHTPALVFVNDVAAKYVLEIEEGKADAYGLFLGTKVIIEK